MLSGVILKKKFPFYDSEPAVCSETLQIRIQEIYQRKGINIRDNKMVIVMMMNDNE
jgi:hypothetical protein